MGHYSEGNLTRKIREIKYDSHILAMQARYANTKRLFALKGTQLAE